MSLCVQLYRFGRQAWCRSHIQRIVVNQYSQVRRYQHTVHSKTSEYESSLFVSGVHQDDTLLLSLDLDIEAMLQDLDSNIHARRHASWNSDNIRQFKDNCKRFVEMRAKLKNIEDDQKNTTLAFKSIKEKEQNLTMTKEKADQERTHLREKGRQLKNQHTSIMDEYFTLEQAVFIRALQIPNHLHIDTPTEDEVKILDKCGSSENVKVSSEKLKKILKKCVKFSNVGQKSYYLMSDAALKEQELIIRLSSELKSSGFTHMVCPEIFKTVPVEGSGIVPPGPEEIYNLEIQDVNKEKTHILPYKEYIRGTSVLSFLAYFTRHVLTSEDLPKKFFTVGRSYDTAQQTNSLPGLYGASQNICAEVAALSGNITQNEAMYHDLQEMLWSSLSNLDIPARMVLVPAHSLHCSERRRTEVQFWSPNLQQYIQVGSLSCYGDYFSRRLMYRQNAKPLKEPVSESSLVYTIHGRWTNITRLVALHLEYSCQPIGAV
ncbi:serine--tRNA ligase, mitochondrial-like isoform X1 [Ylistrum balloti]|uniref:serine--tRNA ligase, mitochondrial-like isoform X1 n=1 Tax=Ylistrum balloti TaxID=509963 RepID=UPI002905DB42|nr:serine--tRNA ligase, mitochondrial-like isoform X1 [Ylistrum balloti]